MTRPLTIAARIENWPISGGFTISRGTKREAQVVVAEVSDGLVTGRGECVPYPRYGESPEASLAQIESARLTDRASLNATMAPGASRNALDCALWDYEAKRSGMRAAERAGFDALKPVLTAFTISLAGPEEMAAKALEARDRPLLKLKLGGDGDVARLRAIRAARPEARLIADANEAWRPEQMAELLAACAENGVELVEQPLPAGEDTVLKGMPRPMPICADESAHTSEGLERLAGLYDAVNIKLDKTGGLTEALAMAEKARLLGMQIMVGCMVATSLSMAPAVILAQTADWVDLDGPLLLERDRAPGLEFQGALILPPRFELWG